MLESLERLNERIYELYGRLYENSELLTKKQSDYIADRLFEQYKAEYALLEQNTEPARAEAHYRAWQSSFRLTPKAPGWFKRVFLRRRKNRVALLFEQEVETAVERGFAMREVALEKVGNEADQAEEAMPGPSTASFDSNNESRAPNGPEADSEPMAQRNKA